MPHVRLSARVAVAAALLFAASPARAAPRVGDADSKPDPAQFDPNYSDMKEWAAAGVRGGIPARDATAVFRTLKPGDDVQAAVDAAGKDVTGTVTGSAGGKDATSGGRVVLLSPGTYPVKKVIDLRPGVVLRGQAKDLVVLENVMRSPRLTADAFTVRFAGVARAGLEDLTVRHAEVARLGLGVYAERVAGAANDPGGVADLHVGGVLLADATDCWVDNVNVLHSGSHPLEAAGWRATVRDTLIDGAFNKGEAGSPAGSGNVYFAVTGGLMTRCAIRNTRHGLVVRDTLSGRACAFNVFLDLDVTGDVNFHGNRRDSGHNLFEGVLVRSLTTHGWPAWAYWKREEVGVGNLAFGSIGWGGSAADAFASTRADKVYTFTGMRDPNVLGELETPAPAHGTLYAVTGERPGRLDPAAWPATPGEARDAMLKRAIPSPAGK
ncbi:MAG: hypothetical protein JWO31_4209 [Phycisphaerales bacterium]|nr:hypothetical protein [Phycisphaerales bacterium]